VTKPMEEILLNDQDRKEIDARKIACHVREIIKLIGEDPNREGLRKTPERFEKALKFLTSGYHQNLDHVLNGATFSVAYDEMVIVKDIEFFSLCEHHLLPFFGKAHVAYLPDKRVLGLSKIARLVNTFARRLQIQERLTSQVTPERCGGLVGRCQDHQRHIDERVVHHPRSPHGVQRVGLGVIQDANAQHPRLGRQPIVISLAAQDAGIGAAEVTGIVIGLAGVVVRQDPGIGMGLPPGRPRGLGRGHHLELGATQRSLNGSARQVTPEAVGFAVVHDQRVAHQLAGNAEGQVSPVHRSGIHDARVAERSPGDGERPAADDIVDDLVGA